MNKKIATLMFAIGLGMAASPVFAASCKTYCSEDFRRCVDADRPLMECNIERVECWDRLCYGIF